MSKKSTNQQSPNSGSETKIVKLVQTKPAEASSELSQKANTVSAPPVSQISNPDPFLAIMAPKPVAQTQPQVAEAVPSAPAAPVAATSTSASTTSEKVSRDNSSGQGK